MLKEWLPLSVSCGSGGAGRAVLLQACKPGWAFTLPSIQLEDEAKLR